MMRRGEVPAASIKSIKLDDASGGHKVER